MKKINKNILAPEGFVALGVHAGIKKAKKDLMILKSLKPAIASGVFTQNVVKAAPVLWDEKIISNEINALIVSSGNANACTGEVGIKHNEMMAKAVADELNVDVNSILTASTGVIGQFMPIEKIADAVKLHISELDNSENAANNAAEAIMTTDTFTKEIAVEINLSGKTVKIGGIAKGSGMIHPNMATMLAFLTTDCNISKTLLNKAFKETISNTFNMISVDGDTSTNDSAIIIANAMALNNLIETENEDYFEFKKALHFVNEYLAKSIVKDGEGATKFITVKLVGADSEQNAKKLVKSVLTSSLVKTAIFGCDANWGRILAALGYSGVVFNEKDVSISFQNDVGEISVYENGSPVNFSEDFALKILKEKDINILIDMKMGSSVATGWGCDLTYDYVKINADYRS